MRPLEADRPIWPLSQREVGRAALPIAVGTLAAFGHPHKKPGAQILTGNDPAPRAWDYVFQGRPDGWIRLRMKSEVWLALVLGVPMEECPACGDRWLDFNVARRLDTLLTSMLSSDAEVVIRHFDATDQPAA